MDKQYVGYRILSLGEEDTSNLYQGKYNIDSLKENEYIIVQNKEEPIDYFKFSKGILQHVNYPVLENNFVGTKIKPKNAQQYCAMDLLKDSSVPLKLITGKFGSGKSMMCIVAALEALQKGKFDKIVFVRNNVQVKDTDPLGALPGDMYNKSLPYLMPFADHCGGIDGIQYLEEDKRLEVIPLAFLRGRSIRNSIIYSMESENLTKEHIQLLMGRVDEGSQLWLDGDLKQRDRINFEKSQGLETLIERLSDNQFFGYVHLIKSERSEIAALADLLD